MPLQINQKSPDFELPSTSGSLFRLSKDAVNQPLILYFYPKDFTRVCTKEACSFRDHFHFFKDLNIRVIGISTDTIQQHQQFKAAHQLPFELLADVKGKVSKAYKASLPLINMSKRITYLLDKNHRIQAVHADLFGSEKHIKHMINQVKKIDTLER